MSNLPKVSIIIPYNRDRGWLKEAKESVRSQTYKGPIDLILSNDPNVSVSKNINKAMSAVTGKYVKFLAEDDLLTPICIEASVEAMQEQKCDFLHGNALNMFPEGDRPYYPAKQFPTLQELVGTSMIHGLTLFYDVEVIRKMIRKRGFWFDESLDCAEEYDVNMWLLANGYKLGYVNKFMGKYRRHETQKSLGKDIDQVARAKRIQAIKNRYTRKQS